MTAVTLEQPDLLPLSLELPALDLSSITRLFSPSSSAQTKARPQEQDAAVLSDEALVLALCHGEEWAMEHLYQRYARYVYALAYRIMHDSFAAEDIVQDVFVSIWCKAASYQEQQGSVRSWLQAIVHHRAIDRIRASAHRDAQWTSLQGDNKQDPPSSAPEVWEAAWQNEQATSIRKALVCLPFAQRQVIEMSYFQGYTHYEIAEQLHLPLGTVKGRMRLGLQKLRGLLQEYHMD